MGIRRTSRSTRAVAPSGMRGQTRAEKRGAGAPAYAGHPANRINMKMTHLGRCMAALLED